MLLADVVAVSSEVSATRARRSKTEAIAGLLAEAAPEELPAVVGFLAGVPRQGRVGVGYAQVYADPIPAAAESTLTVVDVDLVIGSLAAIAGPGAAARRREVLVDLLARATGEEQVFLQELLTGGLRQGALEGIMVDSIARSARLPPAAVRRAFMLEGDLGAVAVLALTGGAAALDRVGLEVLRPLLPMLAKTAGSVEEALSKTGEAAVEWKLDGARIQVHLLGRRIRVFTRNLNDVTERLPEVTRLAASLNVRAAVLDGEAIALDAAARPLRFQETMSRFGADELRGDVALVPFFFDVLHLDGEDLVDQPLRDRVRHLEAVIPATASIPRLLTASPAAAEAFLAEARAAGHEGVMVKGLSSPYEAGRRGAAWVKVKPAHTLDLVILAAEWGHGRRTGWLSNLHLGARDPTSGGYVMLGKTFKGLTDEMLAWQTDRLQQLEVRRTKRTVYVRPELVVEVAFDGVLPSPRYPGGMALRFARVKGHRPDKAAEDSDSLDTVRAIFDGSAGD